MTLSAAISTTRIDDAGVNFENMAPLRRKFASSR